MLRCSYRVLCELQGTTPTHAQHTQLHRAIERTVYSELQNMYRELQNMLVRTVYRELQNMYRELYRIC